MSCKHEETKFIGKSAPDTELDWCLSCGRVTETRVWWGNGEFERKFMGAFTPKSFDKTEQES